MIVAQGIISVSKNGRIVVNTDEAILDYYLWFVKKQFWIVPEKPLYGAHVSIALPHMHEISYKLAKSFDKKAIVFSYSPDIQIGGQKSGFMSFWLRIKSPEIEMIKQILQIKEKRGYKGLHLTLGQAGKRGAKIKPYWPGMIVLKKIEKSS